MQEFEYAPGTTFMLEFCDYGIRFYSNGAQVTTTVPYMQPAWVSGNTYNQGDKVQFVVGITLSLALCRGWLGWITKNADADAAAKALNQLAAAPGTGTPFTSAELATTPKVTTP